MQITLNEIFRFVRTLEDGKLANQTGWTLYLRKFPFLSNDILGIEIEGEPGVYKFPVTESGYYKLWAGANFETLEEEPSYGNDLGKYLYIPEWQSDESNIFISSTGKNVNIASNLNVAGTLSANQIIFSSVTAIELSVTGQELNFLGSVSITGDNVPPIAQNLFEVYKPDSTIPSFLVASSGDVAINSNLSLSGNHSITGNVNASEINSQSYKVNDVLGIDNNPSANTLSRITTSKGIVTDASNIDISSITSGLTSNTIWNKSLSSVFPSFNSDNVAIGNSALTSHKLSVSGNVLINHNLEIQIGGTPAILEVNALSLEKTLSNFTVGNFSNRLLIVGVSIRSGTGGGVDDDVDVATFGGIGLTNLGIASLPNSSKTVLLYLKNPPVSTADIVVTIANSTSTNRRFTIGAVLLYNVDQENTFGTLNVVTGVNSTSISSSTTSEVGDFVLGLASKHDTTETISSDGIEIWNGATTNATGSANVRSGLSYKTATGNSTSITWQWSDTDRNASMLGIAVKPDRIGLSLLGNASVTGSFSLQGTSNTLQLHRITSTQRDLIPNVHQGMLIYNSSITGLQFYTGTTWRSITGF